MIFAYQCAPRLAAGRFVLYSRKIRRRPRFSGTLFFSAQSDGSLKIPPSLSFRPSNASGEILRAGVSDTNSFAAFYPTFTFRTRSLHSVARFSRSLGRDDKEEVNSKDEFLFSEILRRFAPQDDRMERRAALRLLGITGKHFSIHPKFYILHSTFYTCRSCGARGEKKRRPFFRRLHRHIKRERDRMNRRISLSKQKSLQKP